MKINSKLLTIISICYIYLPILIFMVTWTKFSIALFCIVVWAICLYRQRVCNTSNTEKMDYVKIDLIVFISIVLLFIWIGYYVGWGKFVDQAGDWNKHNAVLADLVNRQWPIYYENGNEHSMLTYYIAQYIVPGAIGKLSHSFRVAEIAMYVWNEIGLILVFLNIIIHLKLWNHISQFFCAILIPFFQFHYGFQRRCLKAFLVSIQ